MNKRNTNGNTKYEVIMMEEETSVEKIKVVKGVLVNKTTSQNDLVVKVLKDTEIMASNGWHTELQYQAVFNEKYNEIFFTCMVIGYTYE